MFAVPRSTNDLEYLQPSCARGVHPDANGVDVEDVRVLDDRQVEAFDTDYMYEGRWKHLRACIERDFPSGKFTLLDVGGGNGAFADLVLATYPNARVVVIDLSDLLLSRNKPHPGKTLVQGSATQLQAVDGP